MNQNFKNILSKSRRDRANIYKKEFFDVSIHCLFSILPAHSYVLSYRSPYLADQIALSGNNLNWKEFDDSTSTALLRWIYTDKVVLSDLTDPEQWLDLLHGSYKLQLFPLFIICEQTLLSLIDSYPLQRFYDVAKKCGADQLLEKYSQLRLKAPSISSENGQYQDRNRDIEIYTDDDCSETRMSLDAEEEEEEEQSQSDERDELLQYHKFNLGHLDFKQFSDVKVTTNSGVLYGHAHVLESRSKKFLKEFKQTSEGGRTMRYKGPSGTEKKFFRWIYTDRVEFSKRTKIITLLRCAQYYKLSALCEQCEREIIKKIDLTTCVRYHKFAEKHNAPIILEFCNRLITEYYPKPKSLECLTNGMDVEMDEMESDSLSEMMDLATGRPTDGLLMLNDDCLLHIFRLLSPVNLASTKATCKKLSPLADQAFRLYHDKSLEIKEATMFADIWILMHFGKYIKSLELNKIYERYASLDNIVEMIARYTDGGQLKSISLNKRNEMGSESFESLKRLKTVLKNVEHIEMIELDEMVDTLLSYCENLKEVTFMGEYVQLKCFWYQKNPNITKMRLVGLSNDEMLEQIFKNLTRLEYLTLYLIRTETGKIIHLSRLSSTLKSLEVDGKLPYIGRALQQFPDKTVLNSINLFYVHMTELLANALGDFPNLLNLKFSREANFPVGVRSILSKKLVNIKHLKFNYCDEVIFKEIVEIVENLLDLRTLSVIGCDEIDYIDGQDYLRLHKIRNLKFVVDSFTYKRSAEELLKNSLDNVKLEQVDYDYNNYYEPL